ncbi:EipA family protein [Novosphingobium sp. SL115]|nr:EipA family protein [Novosphingobium sp. SL115]MCY1670998.1 EipA family protein [Novosphingobium sp. SL115]
MAAALAAAAALTASTVCAQVQTIDPNSAIDGDLAPQSGATPAASPVGTEVGMTPALPAETDPATTVPSPDAVPPVYSPPQSATSPAATPSATPTAAQSGAYQEDDLIGAAEGVFGKGASGLADLIKDLLKKQGEPNAYIVGREGGAALVVGLRYGSGTLHHKVEGERPVYWTGPSIGFDAGANAASTFVLVYNLFDSEELYTRFPAGEGQAYLIGGFHVSYLRKGDKVLIPVRSGAGLRLGVNGGYMKFSRKQNWFPF